MCPIVKLETVLFPELSRALHSRWSMSFEVHDFTWIFIISLKFVIVQTGEPRRTLLSRQFYTFHRMTEFLSRMFGAVMVNDERPVKSHAYPKLECVDEVQIT